MTFEQWAWGRGFSLPQMDVAKMAWEAALKAQAGEPDFYVRRRPSPGYEVVSSSDPMAQPAYLHSTTERRVIPEDELSWIDGVLPVVEIFGTTPSQKQWSRDRVKEAREMLNAAPAKPAPSVEPVSYEYQTRDGKWSPFINKKHYEDTVADGSWPIRALYTSQPDTAAQIAELMKLCAEWKAVSDKQSAQVTKLQAKLDVAREALEEIEYNGDPIAIKALAEIGAIK